MTASTENLQTQAEILFLASRGTPANLVRLTEIASGTGAQRAALEALRAAGLIDGLVITEFGARALDAMPAKRAPARTENLAAAGWPPE